MYASQYEEHLAHSAPCASRWDGFDRGDLDVATHHDQGQRVIGRMTNGAGQRVVIVELWFDGDMAYEVQIDGAIVYSDFLDGDRARAITVARWWMSGCPA